MRALFKHNILRWIEELERGTGTAELYGISQKVMATSGEKLDDLEQNPSLSVSEKAKWDLLQGTRLQLVVRLQ